MAKYKITGPEGAEGLPFETDDAEEAANVAENATRQYGRAVSIVEEYEGGVAPGQRPEETAEAQAAQAEAVAAATTEGTAEPKAAKAAAK